VLEKAICVAAEAHKGQKRKGSGIPYIFHPLGVGAILAENGCSMEVITAGILHDTVEDTDLTLSDIENMFGKEVATAISKPTVSLIVLFHIRTAAVTISATITGCIPLNTASIRGLISTFVNKDAISVMMITEGKTIPAVAKIAPILPASLYPIKVDALMAMAPGIVWDAANISIISSFLTHPFLSITSFSIKGIMAKPPPKVKEPILKKVRNNSNKNEKLFLSFNNQTSR
jgi:hypothetical protein